MGGPRLALGSAAAPRAMADGSRIPTAVRRVAGKLGGLLLTLFLASLLVFFSRFLVPGDPARFLLRGRDPSPEAIAAIKAQYGLDLPPWQQYLRWVGGILHGDFGRLLQYRQDVTTVMGERMPTTLLLVIMAGTIIAVVGITLGIVAIPQSWCGRPTG